MKKIKIALYYVLSVHLLALSFMTLQRLVLLFANWQYLDGVAEPVSWVCSALLRGLWFDNVIASALSLLPLFVLSVVALLNGLNKRWLQGFNLFYLIFYLPVFGIGMADIPYFQYFFKHLNVSILNWSEEGGTALGMIFGEASYYLYMLLFVVLIAAFAWLLVRLRRSLLKQPMQNTTWRQSLAYTPLCLLLMGLAIFGVRGRLGYNPIRTSQAYFCNNSFLNQLGISPTFYFIRDIVDSSKSYVEADELISEEDALAIAQRTLLPDPATMSDYPVYRRVDTGEEPRRMNVVLVLMESLSAEFLNVREKGKEITPYLNQLIERSYYFDRFYSAGTHTNQGIMATLYGLPSIFDRNTMKNVDIVPCQGLPQALKERAYRNLFFVTHEAQYDNMNAFLLENGFDEMYAEEDYPREMRRNSFGVADDFLFEYALNVFREKASAPDPFMGTILTISNHPPYIVPERFKSVSDDPQYQVVAFADDAIREFMEQASKEDWYRNTVFVFLGDHGKMVGQQVYAMPLSYHHVPLIIYSPALEDAPRRISHLGGQIDVFPTVMSLLKGSYENNTLGVSLLDSPPRPYIFFASDDALGCLDQRDFYIYNAKIKVEGLYNYQENNPDNVLEQYRTKADSMRMYAASMLRTTDYLLKNQLTRVKKSE